LPVVFIDEAESVLGTRRASRSHNISNTVVPMFCAEMDGIESLQDVVIILTSNRPDLIDPAILRPGRIDRKIKVIRPDEDAAREILGIYLTADLPVAEGELNAQDGNVRAAVDDLVARTIAEIYVRRDDTRFLEVMLRSGRKEVLSRGDLCSGAILESIVQRAKEIAIKRCIASGSVEGIGFDDMLAAIEMEYSENEIFPPTDNTEDWLKLLDYDPENVVRAAPIRPRRERRTSGHGVV
jgi:proteasome-associated ATPase